jgi:hypothetical protein
MGEKPERPLIAGAQIQHENMALGSIAWYLRQMDFRNRTLPWRVDSILAQSPTNDAFGVVRGRNKAAHLPVSELAEVYELRTMILGPDGILSRLHPGTADNSKI